MLLAKDIVSGKMYFSSQSSHMALFRHEDFKPNNIKLYGININYPYELTIGKTNIKPYSEVVEAKWVDYEFLIQRIFNVKS